MFPGPADPTQTLLVEDCAGLDKAMVGMTNSFTVFGRDAYGNPATQSHDPFSAAITIPGGAAVPGSWADVKPLGNGNYSVSYVMPRVGLFSVAVTLLEEHVVGSPFELQVRIARIQTLTLHWMPICCAPY